MKVLLIFAVISALAVAQDINERIVNGQDADVRDFPHVLALYDRGRYFCGASVISQMFAITAAHCLVKSFLKFFNQNDFKKSCF